MIKASELRIGNKIILLGKDYINDNVFPDPEGNVIITVDAETIDDAVYFLDNYEPITLTPELLEKCGFEKEHNCWLLNFTRIGIHPSDQKFYLMHKDFNGVVYNVSNPIEHLHHLQNLYFALTNQELPISEKALEGCDATMLNR